MTFEWLRDIPDIKEHLSRDYRTIADECGVEVLIKLLTLYQKTALYFTTAPITDLMSLYIHNNRYKKDATELARELGVSKKFVYDVLKRDVKQPGNSGQNDLFKEEQ
jgi:hypothetical protein